MADAIYASSSDEEVYQRRVHFREGDDVVEYDQAFQRSPSHSPPLSSPLSSTTHTTDSSEGPSTPRFDSPPLASVTGVGSQSESVIPEMSEELRASFQEPWRFFDDPRDNFWDTFDATANGMKQIILYVDGLPSPFIVEHLSRDKPVLVGDVYRAIMKYLTTAISDDGEEYTRLDERARAKVMQKYLLRKSAYPKSVLERRDLLLERQVFKRIVPFSSGIAWKVHFSELSSI